MVWEVNGTDTSLENHGIEAKIPSVDENGTKNLTLLVSATAENHGAVIQCVAGTPTVHSTAAILRVQGV